MLSSWAKLYRVFARCAALVVTAEENVCCEELCAKMAAAVDGDALVVSGWQETPLKAAMATCGDIWDAKWRAINYLGGKMWRSEAAGWF